jgi:MFS family permease
MSTASALRTDASSGQRQSRPNRERATLALLAFAMLTTSLDQYLVVVALPSIGRELGFSAQTLQWVISANAVTSAGFLMLDVAPPTCSDGAGSS